MVTKHTSCSPSPGRPEHSLTGGLREGRVLRRGDKSGLSSRHHYHRDLRGEAQKQQYENHCGGLGKNGPHRPIYLNIYQELELFEKD